MAFYRRLWYDKTGRSLSALATQQTNLRCFLTLSNAKVHMVLNLDMKGRLPPWAVYGLMTPQFDELKARFEVHKEASTIVFLLCGLFNFTEIA